MIPSHLLLLGLLLLLLLPLLLPVSVQQHVQLECSCVWRLKSFDCIASLDERLSFVGEGLRSNTEAFFLSADPFSGVAQLKTKSERVVELETANEELKGRLQETLASLERYVMCNVAVRLCS